MTSCPKNSIRVSGKYPGTYWCYCKGKVVNDQCTSEKDFQHYLSFVIENQADEWTFSTDCNRVRFREMIFVVSLFLGQIVNLPFLLLPMLLKHEWWKWLRLEIIRIPIQDENVAIVCSLIIVIKVFCSCIRDHKNKVTQNRKPKLTTWNIIVDKETDRQTNRRINRVDR